MENEVMVILPKEVQEIAQNVSAEKRNEVQTVLNHVFNGVAKMRNQLDLVTVSNENDKINMKLANTIRLGVRQVRLESEKTFDAKRAEVQALMVSYKTEDQLWLKAKQTMQILTKEIEENARWKEETRERFEKEQQELKIQQRINKIQKFAPEMMRSEFEFMSDVSFDLFFAGIEKAFNDRIEVEKQAEIERIAKEKAEAEAREAQRIENERLKAEAAEREKQIAIERAEQMRILKAEQAKAEAERKAAEEKAKKEREAAEVKLAEERKIARLAAEKAAAERAKLEAELKAKAEAERKIKEAKEAEEKARIKAENDAKKAPRQKRIIKWIDGFSIEAPDGMQDDAVIIEILKKFASFKEWAKVKANQ